MYDDDTDTSNNDDGGVDNGDGNDDDDDDGDNDAGGDDDGGDTRNVEHQHFGIPETIIIQELVLRDDAIIPIRGEVPLILPVGCRAGNGKHDTLLALPYHWDPHRFREDTVVLDFLIPHPGKVWRYLPLGGRGPALFGRSLPPSRSSHGQNNE